MAAESIGALTVELRANSAQFTAGMETARKSVAGTGHAALGSSKQLARMGAVALEQVVPGLQGMRMMVENVLQQLIKAHAAFSAMGTGGAAAMAVAGPAVGVLAAALGGLALGTFIQNFRELGGTADSFGERIKLAAGFTGSFTERLKAATEEQKKFGEAAAKSRDIMRGLAKEQAAVTGDDAGGLVLKQREREDSIIKSLGGAKAGPALAAARKLAMLEDAKLLAEQRQAREDADTKTIESMTKLRDEQVKTWQTETQALVEQLKTRVKLRQDFEAQFGQGGLPGASTVGGLGAVRGLKGQIQKEARDLAFAQRDMGLSDTDATAERENIRTRALQEAQRLRVEFAAFPAVLDAIDKSIASVEFGNFGREIQQAQIYLAAFVPTSAELTTALGGIANQLIQTLPPTQSATDATRELSQAYRELADSIYSARVEAAALAGAQ